MAQPVPERDGSPARIVLQLIELAAAHGHEPQAVCRNVGISWHVLQNPDARVASDAVERLSLDVAKLIDDPNLALRLAQRSSELAHFDPSLVGSGSWVARGLELARPTRLEPAE